MNFINDRDLALRFKDGAVSSNERFIYLILFVLIIELLSSSFVLHNIDVEQDVYNDIATIAITLIGTIICYNTNKNGDDREFVERYVGISFPVSVQIFLAGAVYVVALMVFYAIKEIYKLEFDYAGATEPYNFVASIGLLIYYYWRLNSSIRLAANLA